MKTMDDKHIINKIKQGGSAANEAFITLDKALRPIMHAILKGSYTKISKREHEDIIQNTFIQIFNEIHKDSFRGEASLKNWAMVILKHKAIDFLRKEERQVNVVPALQMNTSGINDEKALGQTQTHSLNEYDCETQALNAFRKNNVKAYADFLQIIVQGLNLKQFAEMEGIKHGTARERMSSLRKKLRRYIEHFCGKQA